MKMQIKCVLIVICSLLGVSVNAQEYHSLHGRVLNSDGDTIVGAVVSCIELPDSIAITHCITDKDGAFKISGLDGGHGEYLLAVSFLGYEKSYVSPSRNELVVVLKESAVSLNEVTVRASAPVLKQKPGKFIYTPSLSEVRGIDSYTLLHFTPLMTLENNSVRILGKGTSTIYINGRKPMMDNASLMDMLRSTPAGQIENIEIIMSPNSSYKASTTGGIVNIVMKKNPNQGLRGSASLSGAYRGERLSPRTSLYLSYSKKKFNASANLSYSYRNSQSETDVTYNYGDTFTDIFNSTVQQTNGHYLNGNVSMTYDFTKRSTVGASLHVGDSKSKSSYATNSANYVNGIIDRYSSSMGETAVPFRRPEIGVVAYYTIKTDKKGSNLDISANYSSSLSTSFGNMEYANGLDESHLIPYSLFQQNSSVDSYGYEFKALYRHKLNDDNSFEAGSEFNSSHLSNDYVRNDFNDSDYVKNEMLSNNFIYDEKVNSLYATYDGAWGDVFSATLGIRAEHTNVDGNQTTSNEQFSRNYWHFFPELSLLFELADGNHNISLDFSRSIVRPYYNYLNPFKIWTSENTYSMGNIHLKSMTYNDVGLKYRFLKDYVVGAYYSYGSDAFSEYTYLAEGNTTVSSVANFGNEHELSLYFNMNKLLLKGDWRLLFNIGANYDVSNGDIDGQDIGYKKWTAFAEIRNIFSVSKKRRIRGTMSYSYYTPTHGVLKIGKHKHLLNLSLSKEFKLGGTLNIDAMNLLNYKPAYHYNAENYSYNNNPKTNNVTFQLRYTHTFGRNRVRGAQDRSSTNHLGRFKE